MSTPLPRANGATRTPSRSGKSPAGSTSQESELRDFRRASPFDHFEQSVDSEVSALDRNGLTPRPPSEGKIKSGRAASTPIAPIPASERRVDRRFWPKDTRALLELCEQGYNLQQGMESSCKDTADSLNEVAATCENTVKAMLYKLEETLQIMQREAEKPANVDWMPIFQELNQRVGPDIAKDVLARQQEASKVMQEEMSLKLNGMVSSVGEALNSRAETQKSEVAQLQADIREVQKGTAEFEKTSRRQQDAMIKMFIEAQTTLQVQVRDAIAQEISQLSEHVDENRKILQEIEPQIERQLSKQLKDSKASDIKHHEQIHQIHKTLHTDLGQLFFEIAEIQKGLNLPFLHLPAIDHYSKAKEGAVRAREIDTQTERAGEDASCQTDLGITMPVDEKGKKKKGRHIDSQESSLRDTIHGSKAVVMAMKGKASTHVNTALHAFETEADQAKKLRKKMIKPQYNVADYYYETGYIQAIARNSIFENTTFMVILANACWIAVDTDHNDASVLTEAHLVFQVAENLFCSYFFFEVVLRFLAFRTKRNCLRDFWFVFDTVLVAGMVAETWVLTAIIHLMNVGASAGAGQLSILRLARLVKMFRMARMARLLRMVPELMMIVKGISAAFRSVWFFVLLTVIILYVFAVAFRQITKGTEVGDQYFQSVPMAMNYLLLDGMLPIYAPMVRNVSRDNPEYWPIIVVFILLASITVLNMLIGVLSEVVRSVAAREKEAMTVTHVTHQLKGILGEFQAQGNPGGIRESSSNGSFTPINKLAGAMKRASTVFDPKAMGKKITLQSQKSTLSVDAAELGRLTKEDFNEFVMKDNVAQVIQEVGVDPVGLSDMSEAIFEDKDKQENGISFEDFIEVVLNLRGSNPATVKDIKEAQRVLKMSMFETRVENKKNMQREVGSLEASFLESLKEITRELQRLKDDRDDSDSDEDSRPTNVNRGARGTVADISAYGHRSSGDSQPALSSSMHDPPGFGSEAEDEKCVERFKSGGSTVSWADPKADEDSD